MMMFVRLLVWCLLYTDVGVCTLAGVVCYLLYTDVDVCTLAGVVSVVY